MALGARWMVICQFLGQRTRTKSKASTFLYFQWFFMPNTINLSKFHGCPRLCFFVLAVQINIYARKKNGSGRNTSFIMPLPNMKSKASTFLHFQAFLVQLRRNSSKTPWLVCVFIVEILYFGRANYRGHAFSRIPKVLILYLILKGHPY